MLTDYQKQLIIGIAYNKPFIINIQKGLGKTMNMTATELKQCRIMYQNEWHRLVIEVVMNSLKSVSDIGLYIQTLKQERKEVHVSLAIVKKKIKIVKDILSNKK